MANATVSRLGQANLAGDVKALFLKVFSGEVMTTFNTRTMMKGRTRVRSIEHGKSAQFPAIGKVVARYHTPGAEIVGQTVEHGEKTITIDDLLISDVFIARIDEAANHYDVRSEYTFQMGDALAQTYDRNLLSMAVKACSTPDTGAVADMGDADNVNIGLSPTATDIIDALYDAAAEFDNRNIPEAGRAVIVDPVTYFALVRDKELVNMDNSSGNGDFAQGKVYTAAGFEIVKSNNLAVNHTTSTDYPDTSGNKYGVDATATKALIMHPQALGTVELLGMATEAEYDIRRQGWLAVSKFAVGHGVLRPECLRTLTAA